MSKTYTYMHIKLGGTKPYNDASLLWCRSTDPVLDQVLRSLPKKRKYNARKSEVERLRDAQFEVPHHRVNPNRLNGGTD